MSYTELFHIDFQHSYYSDGIFRELKTDLSPESSSLFAKLGIISRMQNGTLSCYIDQTKLSLLSEIIAEEPELFCAMKLYCTNPYFLNFSDFGNTQSNSILFLQPSESRTKNNIRLSTSEFVSAQDLTDVSDERCAPLLSPKDKLVPPLGLIYLQLKTITDQLTEQKIQNTFSLQFQERKTIWHYYAVSSTKHKKDIFIKDISGICAFTEPSKITLANGKEALLFISEQPLALQEHPSYRFQLMARTQHAQKTIIKQLPAASPSFIERTAEGSAAAYKSNVYFSY